ncbi:MAG: dipeptidase [Candidatus Cryptobacteroides sp.]
MTAPVLDSHCDTPSQILRLRDLALDAGHSQVDFPKLRKGGVNASFFALYVPASMDSERGYEYACRLYDGVADAVARNSGTAAFAVSPEDISMNMEKGLFSVCLGLENGEPLASDPSRLEEFYAKGVRYVTLCHSRDNSLCDSCAQGSTWNGLSRFGREMVVRMNSLGMMVDVSHISDKSFYDVLETSSRPVVATHSCCRALASHPRNMTDGMIRDLASAGGVIQINFYPVFLDDGFRKVLETSGLEERGESVEKVFIADPSDDSARAAWYGVLDELSSLPRPSYRRIADHIDHVVGIAGIDFVGLGSDFDGICVTPSGLDSVASFGLVLEELSRRGYSEEDIAKISGGNFLRVWKSNN